MRSWAQIKSWICPAVSIRLAGLPKASTRAWIFVVNRRAIGRSLGRRLFLGAGAVLMGAHNGGVDHHVFVVDIARQQSENTIKNPAFRPPAEALMHALPIAEAHRQIAPWHTGSEPVQNRFNEQPVIRCRAANVPLPPRQNILDPIPLVVAQAKALHRSASSCRPPMSQTISDSLIPIRTAPASSNRVPHAKSL